MSTELTVAPARTELDGACKNCGTDLSGKYCCECGQRDKHIDPSLHDLVHEFIHEFLHLDGKIVATLKALVLSPGRLTAEFLAGRRNRYIGPVRVYLTLSLLFFLVAAHNPERASHKGDAAKSGSEFNIVLNTEPGKESAQESQFLKRVSRANENRELFKHAFLTNLSRVIFATVPLFALALRLAYRNRKRRYPAFVYFALHYHAFAFLALTLVWLAGYTHLSWLDSAFGYGALLALPGYLFLALRRVFGGSRGNTVLRMMALALFYLPCSILCVGVAALVSLYTV